jgi:hypothetical protein
LIIRVVYFILGDVKGFSSFRQVLPIRELGAEARNLIVNALPNNSA